MTRDDIIFMACKVWGKWPRSMDLTKFEHAMRLAYGAGQAAEREACAEMCESLTHPEASSDFAWSVRSCAAAIRARGEL